MRASTRRLPEISQANLFLTKIVLELPLDNIFKGKVHTMIQFNLPGPWIHIRVVTVVVVPSGFLIIYLGSIY